MATDVTLDRLASTLENVNASMIEHMMHVANPASADELNNTRSQLLEQITALQVRWMGDVTPALHVNHKHFVLHPTCLCCYGSAMVSSWGASQTVEYPLDASAGSWGGLQGGQWSTQNKACQCFAK